MHLSLWSTGVPWKVAFSTLLLGAAALTLQAESSPSTLSVSTDLTSLGIAPQNLLPNQNDVNAGPVLDQATDRPFISARAGSPASWWPKAARSAWRT
jgi:hypothetical protein